MPKLHLRRMAQWTQGVHRFRKIDAWVTCGIVLLLYVFAYETFSNAENWTRYRRDHSRSIARPITDARHTFESSLAIATGDGWVNWEQGRQYRWTVYKPGWVAILAVLGYLTNYSTLRMQEIITFALAATGPLLFLLFCAVYTGEKGKLLAFLVAMAVIIYPQTSWWFMITMMTEGPSLLLTVLFCAGLVYAGRLGGRGLDSAGFLLGLCAALLCLVREQSRFAVVAALVLMLVAVSWHARKRAWFAFIFCLGFGCLAGPYYLKTSYHLGELHTGTGYTSLLAVLDYSKVGLEAGGAKLSDQESATEAGAIRAMKKRALSAAVNNLLTKSPRSVFREWRKAMECYWFSSIARMVGEPIGDPIPDKMRLFRKPFTLICWVMMTLGVLYTFGRHGALTLVPLAFAMGYCVPLVMFSFYYERFGAPISWIGPMYCFASLQLLALNKDDRNAFVCRLGSLRAATLGLFRRAACFKHAGAPVDAAAASDPAAPRDAPQGGVLRPALCWILPAFLWVLAATCLLVWLDLRPLKGFDTVALLDDPRTKSVLADAGMEVDAVLRHRIAGARRNQKWGNVEILNVYLPLFLTPGSGRAAYSGFPVFEPQEEPYTAYLANTGWKRSGQHEVKYLTTHGRVYSDFRHGDEVVVIYGDSARAVVIPTKWQKPEVAPSGRPGVLRIPAAAFSAGSVSVRWFGDEQCVLHEEWLQNVWVAYNLQVKVSGIYDLYILYGAEESRPCILTLDGVVIAQRQLDNVTAGQLSYFHARWFKCATISLRSDEPARLEIKPIEETIPHIFELALVPPGARLPDEMRFMMGMR